MELQVVNTPGISAAAEGINGANNNINSAFQRMRTQMQQLNNWQGSAGDFVQTIVPQLLAPNDARSMILRNYTNILWRQVNPGYISAENTNTSLADNFK